MSPDEADAREEQIGRILNEFLDRRARGEPVSDQDLLKQHPDLANELREHLTVLRQIPSPHVAEHPSRDVQDREAIPGYKIVEEIGRGGMGVVYKAYQQSTKRVVALKVMLDGPFASETGRRRFEREVELIAQLKHPNIVTIYESGILSGKYYLAMDCIDGQRLDAFASIRQLSVKNILAMFATVCDASNYAHQRGVIHRDLKPTNILVDEEGQPHVLDFGLAKQMGDSGHDQVSSTGQLLGTLPYMSPEQTQGELADIDIRTDVYSLGVILYELITNSPPYETKGDLTIALQNIREANPPRPSKLRKGINSEIDAIILKALEKEPGCRYQSAGELGQDIVALLGGRPVAAKSVSSLYVVRKLAVRHRYVTAVVSLLLLTILSTSAISLGFYRQAKKALGAQSESDQAAITARRDLDEFIGVHFSTLRYYVLGTFLLEWHAGRLDQARRIQSATREGTPQRLAMEFLLNDEYTLDALLAQLPAGSESLAYFAAGERDLEAGRTQEAITSFQACLKLPCSNWLKSSVEARVTQLRPKPAPATSAGE